MAKKIACRGVFVAKNSPTILSLAFSDGVPKSALIVAVVVGSILNIINQGDAFFSGGPVNLLKLLLTFMVPYCVSTYGSVTMKLRIHRRLVADKASE